MAGVRAGDEDDEHRQDAIPDLSENQVIVFADWMGRSPQEIEDQVTYPLSSHEEAPGPGRGVKVVRSSSEFNFAMITIIFDDATDYYFARQRVLERLATVAPEMPAGVVPYMAPDGRRPSARSSWYTVEAGAARTSPSSRSIQEDWYCPIASSAACRAVADGRLGGRR